MHAIDTNILVYAVDHDEPLKQQVAIQLLEQLSQPSRNTLLLWQVAAEFLNCLRKWQHHGKISAVDVDAHHQAVRRAFRLVVPSEAIFDRSTRLRRQYFLSHWDSMLIAACIEAGATTLYSEDLSDGMTYESVTVINPLM